MVVPPNVSNLSQQELTNLLGAGGQVAGSTVDARASTVHSRAGGHTLDPCRGTRSHQLFSERPCFSSTGIVFRIADSAAHSVSMRSSDIDSVSEINRHDSGNRNQ